MLYTWRFYESISRQDKQQQYAEKDGLQTVDGFLQSQHCTNTVLNQTLLSPPKHGSFMHLNTIQSAKKTRSDWIRYTLLLETKDSY